MGTYVHLRILKQVENAANTHLGAQESPNDVMNG
jgi:hypothetical protein